MRSLLLLIPFMFFLNCARIDTTIPYQKISTQDLLRYISSGERAERLGAIEALADRREENPEVIEGLIDNLKDKDIAIQEATINTLGKLRDHRATPRLVESLSSPSSSIRRASLIALGKIKDPSARDNIAFLLDDPDTLVKWNAASILSSFTKGVTQDNKSYEFLSEKRSDLLNKLESEGETDYMFLSVLTESMYTVDPDKTNSILYQEAEDGHRDVRLLAIIFLLDTNEDAKLFTLLRSAIEESESEELKLLAVDTICKYKRTEFLAEIERILKSSANERLKVAAAEAIRILQENRKHPEGSRP